MKKNFPIKKLWAIIASLPLSFLSNISSSPAQPVVESSPSAEEAIPAENLDSFNLSTTEAVIPDELEQSERPFEGRAVIGFDERVPLTTRKYPWSAIGKVEGIGRDGSGYACTGTLLAPDIVLTNAHCVVNPDTHQVSRRIWFKPNLIFGTLQDERDQAYVTRFYYGTDFTDSKVLNSNDWAILKLDRPVGRRYGTLPWSDLPTTILQENPEQFALVGYSGDFPEYDPGETAGVHLGCSILGEAKQLLIHNCDSSGGASGGPIIGLVNGQFRIVALHAGTVKFSDGRVVNYAVPMYRLAELFH